MTVGYPFTGGDPYDGPFHGKLYWAEGEPKVGILGLKLSDMRVYAARAFCCPKCGLLQFYATKREY